MESKIDHNYSKDNPLQIDGSILEGGGQILRIAISMSYLLGIPIKIRNIRSKRDNPGLQRQHLTCTKFITSLYDSQDVSGLQLNSDEINLVPTELLIKQEKSYEIKEGRAFTRDDDSNAAKVAIIGSTVESELFGDIVEAVEMVEAHCRKLSATLCDVCFRIVIWNVGQTDGYILLFPVGGKPMEVVNNLTVVCRGISAIDVWIHILDVNNVVVDVGSHRLYMSAVDIQRRLHVSTPSRWFQFAILAVIFVAVAEAIDTFAVHVVVLPVAAVDVAIRICKGAETVAHICKP